MQVGPRQVSVLLRGSLEPSGENPAPTMDDGAKEIAPSSSQMARAMYSAVVKWPARSGEISSDERCGPRARLEFAGQRRKLATNCDAWDARVEGMRGSRSAGSRR